MGPGPFETKTVFQDPPLTLACSRETSSFLPAICFSLFRQGLPCCVTSGQPSVDLIFSATRLIFFPKSLVSNPEIATAPCHLRRDAVFDALSRWLMNLPRNRFRLFSLQRPAVSFLPSKLFKAQSFAVHLSFSRGCVCFFCGAPFFGRC